MSPTNEKKKPIIIINQTIGLFKTLISTLNCSNAVLIMEIHLVHFAD